MSKIQILGRWLCMLVLRYCRDAPLKTTAIDYKRGREASSSKEEEPTSNTSNYKKHLKEIMDTVTAECEAKMTELKTLIKQVEEQGKPRAYVINRKQRKYTEHLLISKKRVLMRWRGVVSSMGALKLSWSMRWTLRHIGGLSAPHAYRTSGPHVAHRQGTSRMLVGF